MMFCNKRKYHVTTMSQLPTCDFPGNPLRVMGNPGVSNVGKLGRPWEVTNMSQPRRKAATGKWFWDVLRKFPVSTARIHHFQMRQ
jgi:hypothetical protein